MACKRPSVRIRYSPHCGIRPQTIFDTLDTKDCNESESGGCHKIAAGKDTQSVYVQAVDAKVRKGAWRMPWLKEAMKDVGSCENLR